MFFIFILSCYILKTLPTMDKIYFVFKTRSVRYAGTKSDPVLILSDYNRDLLQHTFEVEGGIKEGATYFLTADLTGNNLSQYIPFQRVGLRGADAWRPDHLFVFGERRSEDGSGILPLGAKLWTPDELSTDESEGLFSLPLNRANLGGNYTRMNRFLLVIENGQKQWDGTKDKAVISIFGEDGDQLANIEVPAGELAEKGAAFLHIEYISTVFHSNQITEVKLSIEGDDKWTPNKIFLFGMDERSGDNEFMVPLVSITDYAKTGLPALSTDSKEGEAEVLLYRAYL